jgi:hypothetical protein
MPGSMPPAPPGQAQGLRKVAQLSIMAARVKSQQAG